MTRLFLLVLGGVLKAGHVHPNRFTGEHGALPQAPGKGTALCLPLWSVLQGITVHHHWVDTAAGTLVGSTCVFHDYIQFRAKNDKSNVLPNKKTNKCLGWVQLRRFMSARKDCVNHRMQQVE